MAPYFSAVSVDSRTYLIYPGFEILARWCKLCEHYETVDLDIGLYVSSKRLEELPRLAEEEFVRIWNEYVAADTFSLTPIQQEHKYYLQNRVRVCV